MRRHLVLLVLSGLSVASWGCSEPEGDDGRYFDRPETPDTPRVTRDEPEGFRRVDTLEASRFLGDSTAFARITSITHLDGLLLVTDRRTSPHLALVDPESGDVVDRAGGHGEGPSEFRDASDAVADLRTPEPTDAWVYDGPTSRVTRVTVSPGDDRLNLDDPVPLRVDLPLERPVRLDSTWLSNGRFADATLVRFLADGTVLDTVPGRPPWTPDEMDLYVGRRLLNRTFMDVRADGSKVALAYQFAPRVAIFSTEGRYLVDAPGPVETSASYRVSEDRFFWEDDNEMAYWAVDATDRHVYALFCGCALEDEGRPREIHVFSWDGELEAVVPLSREVLAIEVSRDDSTLWGAVETPYPFIAEWDLPTLD